MEPTNSKISIVARILLKLFVPLLSCIPLIGCIDDWDEDECDNPREKWCDGDIIRFCEPGSTHNSANEWRNCSDYLWGDYHLTCLEWTNENGNSNASCAIPHEECPNGDLAFCIGDFASSCQETDIPVVDKYCLGDGWSCEETDAGEAECANDWQ